VIDLRATARQARDAGYHAAADALEAAADALDRADYWAAAARAHHAAAIHHADQAQAYARDAARLADQP
jgi:hypothetical protein